MQHFYPSDYVSSHLWGLNTILSLKLLNGLDIWLQSCRGWGSIPHCVSVSCLHGPLHDNTKCCFKLKCFTNRRQFKWALLRGPGSKMHQLDAYRFYIPVLAILHNLVLACSTARSGYLSHLSVPTSLTGGQGTGCCKTGAGLKQSLAPANRWCGSLRQCGRRNSRLILLVCILGSLGCCVVEGQRNTAGSVCCIQQWEWVHRAGRFTCGGPVSSRVDPGWRVFCPHW